MNIRFILASLVCLFTISSVGYSQEFSLYQNNRLRTEFLYVQKGVLLHADWTGLSLSDSSNAMFAMPAKVPFPLSFTHTYKKAEINLFPVLELDGGVELPSKKILSQSGIGLGTKISWNTRLTAFAWASVHTLQTSEYMTTQYIDSLQMVPHGADLGTHRNRQTPAGGYLAYTTPSRVFDFRLGYGRQFWGDGFRSLWISDNAQSYPYIKATADVWKFKYGYLLAQLKNKDTENQNQYTGKSYLASHYLSWNALEWLNIGLFESVTWYDQDSLGYRGIDVNYLNPIIFIRPVEFSLGGAYDNMLMGFSAKIRIRKKWFIYTQGILDEFELSALKERNSYWGNKVGFQTGIKTFDLFGIQGLFARAEYNQVRPFTYSHRRSQTAFGNFQQPLAHPLGANFREGIGELSYYKNRMSVEAELIMSQYGADSSAVSYGHNLFKPYDLRAGDYEQTLLQGDLHTVTFAQLKFSYLLDSKTNLQVEALVYNRLDQSEHSHGNQTGFLIGIKTALWNNRYDF